LGILRVIGTGIGIGFCFFALGCGDIAIPLSSAPNISHILPQTLTAGSKTQTMKVVGTNFTSTAVILWNGSTLPTSVVDSNTLVGTVESSSLAVPAVVQLKVQIRQTGRESQPVPVTVASAPSIGSPVVNASPLLVSTTQVPSGAAGNAYSTNLAATGGTGAYTWSITSGALPRGLTLAASTGVISGTPVASGTSSFTIRVTDSGNPAQTASAVESIAVAAVASAGNALTITTSSLPSGWDGTAYAQVLQASGGTPSATTGR